MPSKQTLTLDVPDGWDLNGEFRRPKAGDIALIKGVPTECSHLGEWHYPYPILRKAWAPPKYLPEGCWLYKHANGEWFVCYHKPTCNNLVDFHTSSAVIAVSKLACLHNETFVPPTHTTVLQVKHD